MIKTSTTLKAYRRRQFVLQDNPCRKHLTWKKPIILVCTWEWLRNRKKQRNTLRIWKRNKPLQLNSFVHFLIYILISRPGPWIPSVEDGWLLCMCSYMCVCVCARARQCSRCIEARQTALCSRWLCKEKKKGKPSCISPLVSHTSALCMYTWCLTTQQCRIKYSMHEYIKGGAMFYIPAICHPNHRIIECLKLKYILRKNKQGMSLTVQSTIHFHTCYVPSLLSRKPCMSLTL